MANKQENPNWLEWIVKGAIFIILSVLATFFGWIVTSINGINTSVTTISTQVEHVMKSQSWNKCQQRQINRNSQRIALGESGPDTFPDPCQDIRVMSSLGSLTPPNTGVDIEDIR